MPVIRHRLVHVSGVDVFVREAGEPARPGLMLLHGFPSSSRQYVRLIDRLAGHWHVIAPDYPGFGLSDPLPESPTFDRLAEITAGALDTLGVDRYALYAFGFGAPVGFRTALAHDRRVRAVISQNANAYTDGFGPAVTALAGWWADRQAGQPAIDAFVTLEGTRTQWLAGARDPEHIDPSQYLADQAILDLPGRAAYMKDLLWDYQHTIPRYQDSTPGCRTAAPRSLPSGAATTRSSSPSVREPTAPTSPTPRSSCSTPATSRWEKKPTPSPAPSTPSSASTSTSNTRYGPVPGGPPTGEQGSQPRQQPPRRPA